MPEGSPLVMRVFLSSPGDVADERRYAREVMTELERSHLLRGTIRFEISAWDDALAAVPMVAGETPQVSVNRYMLRPAECDLTLLILWSRIGTPLPASFTRADGSRYESGTVWEYEDASSAGKTVFIYRRTSEPMVGLDAPDIPSRLSQFAAIKAFFAKFSNTDGSLKDGFNEYADPAGFKILLRQHLEAYIQERHGAEIPQPSISMDDPRVDRILKSLGEALIQRDKEIEQLRRQVEELRRTGIARTLMAATRPGADEATIAAADALEAGDTRPAVALLKSQETEEAEQIGRHGDDVAPQRRHAAELASEQGALALFHDVSAALAAYQRAAEYDPDDTWTHFILGDLYVSRGNLNAALQSFRRGAATAEARLQVISSDTEALRDLSVSYDGIGDVLIEEGNAPEALASYRKGLAIAEALAARDPDNHKWQRDLSISYDRIGNVLVDHGDIPAALVAYRKGLTIRETLAERDSSSTEGQRDLAVSYDNIGDALLRQSDEAGALDCYRKSLAIVESLTIRDVSNAEWQRDLSASYDRIGDVLADQGYVTEALEVYRKGLSIMDALSRGDAANVEWQRDLSVGYDGIGNMLAEQGDESGAIDAYRKGLAIAEALVKRDPSNMEWQRDLAVSYEHMGDGIWEQGDTTGALDAYRNALTIREKLVDRDPTNTVWQYDLSVILERVGDALAKLLDTPAALQAYGKGRAVTEALAAREPNNPKWKTDIADWSAKIEELDR